MAGTTAHGISLNELKLVETLGAESFASTQRNARRGDGNTDPRRAYPRPPASELSREGLTWLSGRLDTAFEIHGEVPADTLAALGWPTVPG